MDSSLILSIVIERGQGFSGLAPQNREEITVDICVIQCVCVRDRTGWFSLLFIAMHLI